MAVGVFIYVTVSNMHNTLVVVYLKKKKNHVCNALKEKDNSVLQSLLSVLLVP